MSNKVDKGLNQRSNSFFCVFNDSGANVFKNENSIYYRMTHELPIKFIALIQHDNEYDEVEKRIKTNHYHVYFNLKDYQVCSLSSMLNKIVDIFHCNANQISIEKSTDECKCVRYLIHLDNLEKQKYLPFDVVTNNQMLVSDYFSRVTEILDVKDVIEVVKQCNYNVEDIMLRIGSKNWKHWRTEILDLKRDLRY